MTDQDARDLIAVLREILDVDESRRVMLVRREVLADAADALDRLLSERASLRSLAAPSEPSRETAPGHTDLMISPEAIDEALANDADPLDAAGDP